MARSNAYVGGGRKLNGVCKMICGFKDDGTMGMVVKWVMKFLIRGYKNLLNLSSKCQNECIKTIVCT